MENIWNSHKSEYSREYSPEISYDIPGPPLSFLWRTFGILLKANIPEACIPPKFPNQRIFQGPAFLLMESILNCFESKYSGGVNSSKIS
jgi:hypothetical protein